MAILPVYYLGQPILRETAAPIEAIDDELRTLVDDMFETMDAALGVGLAANQIGVARRVAVIDTEEHRFVMINPRVTASSGKAAADEGCLSIPDAFAEVTRPEAITLEALDIDGKPFTLELTGLSARAVQHEIDHLDGVLFIDHVSPLKRQLLVSRWKKEHRDAGPTWTPSPEESEAGA
ncbi:MAG: peptide deformylase [Gemmatimonadetes bacterium]|nr:peptide deformylase [Gemmatimonadota bacterium]MCB9504772.1 peptide deformylase [Gemmatimonadales bacterium]MCA9761891.1 peptide deformylase [Gemmatimonadota bacterium]MCA9768789.1 peptide deformylase [Gemmatimonadota bacterium]HPF63057.1 peptide deformylase [Gemmatimonadales bacterium]